MTTRNTVAAASPADPNQPMPSRLGFPRSAIVAPTPHPADAWGIKSYDHIDIGPVRLFKSNVGPWTFHDEHGRERSETDFDCLERLVRTLRAGGSGTPESVKARQYADERLRQARHAREQMEAADRSPEAIARRQFDRQVNESLQRLRQPTDGGIVGQHLP